jgi:hypothetical protein
MQACSSTLTGQTTAVRAMGTRRCLFSNNRPNPPATLFGVFTYAPIHSVPVPERRAVGGAELPYERHQVSDSELYLDDTTCRTPPHIRRSHKAARGLGRSLLKNVL